MMMMMITDLRAYPIPNTRTKLYSTTTDFRTLYIHYLLTAYNEKPRLNTDISINESA